MAGVDSGLEEHFARTSSEERARASRLSLRTGRPRSPTHSDHGSLIRHSLLRMSESKRAKKVRFYRNGDRFFRGMVYAVSPERFRTFESLLAELTESPLCDKVVLPQGVRHIFSVDGAHRITNLDQLQEGESYVCASTEVFRKMNYSKSDSPSWSYGNTKAGSGRETRQSGDSSKDGLDAASEEARDFIKPKLVTVIRNGTRPRKAVRILLNKKTAHSFEQVLNDITDAIKLDSGQVKRIYTVDGRPVSCLADFFQDETVFVAYGSEKITMDDFDLDNKEVKLVSAYKSGNSRSRERVTLRSPRTPRKSPSTRSLQNGMESPSSSRLSSASPKSPRRVRAPAPSSSRQRMPNGTSANNINGSSPSGEEDKELAPDALVERYDIGQVIGEGNFATVMEATDRFNNRKFALKIIDKRKCQGKEKMIESEVEILRKVKHPNIILLAEDFHTPTHLYLVMELVRGGDLFDAISTATKYTEQDASGMVYNLASALKYLHSLHIVHRDVKPENILVCEHEDGSKSLKLGDFGLATFVDPRGEPLYTVCGTPTYVAPEVLAESGYGLKADVWSAGVITYILLCGFPPFHSDEQEALFDQIVAGQVDFPSPYWDDVSAPARDLILHMLDVNQETRFSAGQVLDHPWVADDEALDADLHPTIAKALTSHFPPASPRRSPDSAGIRLITNTALDKGSRYFQGRGNLPLSLHNRAPSEEPEEDEVF